VRATGVKCGDLAGGTVEASGMLDYTRMAECTGMSECTEMAEPTEIVEDHAAMAKSSWMSSAMAEAIGIHEAVEMKAIGIHEVVEMNESIVTTRACWVVGAIGLVEASGMLVGMSIPSTKIIEI
jgi:hypothetical protein